RQTTGPGDPGARAATRTTGRLGHLPLLIRAVAQDSYSQTLLIGPGDVHVVGSPLDTAGLLRVSIPSCRISGSRLKIVADQTSTLEGISHSAALSIPGVVRIAAGSGHRITYSITSAAPARSGGGTDRPKAFAVLRLITNSY